MPTIQVSGINVIAAYVTDLETSKEFYINHLGFKEGDPMPPGQLLHAENLTLYLEGGKKPSDKKPLEYTGVTACFCQNQDSGGVKEIYGKLKNAGVMIALDYKEFAPTFAIFCIADPDGNVFEFAGKP